jgi:hypothetical protein
MRPTGVVLACREYHQRVRAASQARAQDVPEEGVDADAQGTPHLETWPPSALNTNFLLLFTGPESLDVPPAALVLHHAIRRQGPACEFVAALHVVVYRMRLHSLHSAFLQLSVPVLLGLIKYWPITNSSKEVRRVLFFYFRWAFDFGRLFHI